MHFEFQNKLNGNICLRASTINLNEAHAPHKKKTHTHIWTNSKFNQQSLRMAFITIFLILF